MKLSRLALLVLCFLVAACGTQPPPLPDQAAEDRVAVDIDRFGVGSVIRPGSYAGLRIVLTSGFDEAKNFWVQWEVPNADGDIAEIKLEGRAPPQ